MYSLTFSNSSGAKVISPHAQRENEKINTRKTINNFYHLELSFIFYSFFRGFIITNIRHAPIIFAVFILPNSEFFI